jgi:hypothetical protein
MNKKEKATLLFDGMSLIDDRFIEEADTYVPRVAVYKRKFAVVAALAACLSIILVFSIAPMLFKTQSPSGGGSHSQEITPPTVMNEYELILSQGSTEERAIDIHSVNLSDGAYRLIWLDLQSGVYYEKTLTRLQLYTLKDLASRSETRGEQSGVYRIWLVDALGEVTTPELISSPGNVYYGSLFYYEPELLISDSFIEELDFILN